MDIKAYIDSGILEDYVLGHTSSQEQREVRCLSAIYPEIEAEIVAIEHRLMQVSTNTEMPRPSIDMAQFMKTIKETPQLPAEEAPVGNNSKNMREVSLSERLQPVWRYAAMLALVTGLALLFFALNQNKNNVRLAQKSELLEAEVDRMNLELNQMQLMAEVVGGKDVKKITLTSPDTTSAQFASVYWDQNRQSVYLDAQYLPKPPEGKQYQLWVLKDGNPIDQGVIPLDANGIHLMKPAQQADAFAITLEDKGGKPSPTLEQLKVLGKV